MNQDTKPAETPERRIARLEGRIEKLEHTLGVLHNALHGDAGATAGKEPAARALRDLISDVLNAEGWWTGDRWDG